MAEENYKLNTNFHGTTILAVRRAGKVALAGDGQVTLGSTVVKHSAVKIRRMGDGKVLAGFAGSTADALTLFDKFEAKLDQYRHNLTRASVELAKEWRTDKYLRRLEALMIVADLKNSFVISGSGDVLEPEEGIAAIGSGGSFASSAARALIRHTKFGAKKIVEESMRIAAETCVYTNDSISIEEL